MSDTNTNFSEYLAQERARLNGERAEVLAQHTDLQGKLASVNRELAAIDAYESARIGKSTVTRTRTRRGGKREALIQVISASDNGMSRSELLDHFGVKGDKSGEMSVSNALMVLAKSGQLRRDNRRYFVTGADSTSDLHPWGQPEQAEEVSEAAE